MGLRQNSGMDRPAVIQTYGTVWITCVLVWIGGMDRPVGSGYGSGLYILTHYLSIYLPFSLSSVYLSTCLSVYLSIYPSIYLSICLPVYLCCSVIQCNVV